VDLVGFLGAYEQDEPLFLGAMIMEMKLQPKFKPNKGECTNSSTQPYN